jgi:hypothetical protein
MKGKKCISSKDTMAVGRIPSGITNLDTEAERCLI